ncbi:unnamed protein product, partial [Musa textilis]
MYTCVALMAIQKALTLVSLVPFFDGGWISGRDLDVACLLGAPFHIPFLVAEPIGAADLVTVGDKGPGQVHGGGGEGAAPNTEEEADHDHEDVFGAISEGAEPEGGRLCGDDLAAGEEPQPRDHSQARVGVEGGADGGDDAVDGDESVGPVVTGEGSVGGGGDGVRDEDSVARVEGDAGASSSGGGEEGKDAEEEGEGGARGRHRGISGAKDDGKNWRYPCG